jgi:hypothetical protein
MLNSMVLAAEFVISGREDYAKKTGPTHIRLACPFERGRKLCY